MNVSRSQYLSCSFYIVYSKQEKSQGKHLDLLYEDIQWNAWTIIHQIKSVQEVNSCSTGHTATDILLISLKQRNQSLHLKKCILLLVE